MRTTPTAEHPTRIEIAPPVRDLVIDVAHGHMAMPQLSFAPLLKGTWAKIPLDDYTGTVSLTGRALDLLLKGTPRNFGSLHKLMDLHNESASLTLRDGSTISADLAHMHTLDADGHADLHHWSWNTSSTPTAWLGHVRGRIPWKGNLGIVELQNNQFRATGQGYRLQGAAIWYIIPDRDKQGAKVVLESSGHPVDSRTISADVHAMQFSFGGAIAIDYLIGIDHERQPVSAFSIPCLQRPRSNYRPPVPHRFNEVGLWIPEIFRLLSAKLQADGLEPLVIPIAAYLDAESDHLDGAYLKAHIGLEAFAKRITAVERPTPLVNNEKAWRAWISSLAPEVRAHLRNDEHLELVLGKFTSAMHPPSGDLVRQALAKYGVELPKYARDEVKKRNYAAHGFFMNATIDHEVDVDVRRLEIVQTLLAALVACYIGYCGPLHGYDVADDGGRIPVAWWPSSTNPDVVWTRYVAERNTFTPPPPLEKVTDEASIRERAYYLWRTRTGAAWWDPVSNWLEAERHEQSRAG